MRRTAQEVERREHSENTLGKRVHILDAFGGIVTEGNYTKRIDEASDTTTYIGIAQIGTLTSESLWQIKRISVSGTVTSIGWAEATDEFTNEWDERASYSYS